jgi:hypothetical protein
MSIDLPLLKVVLIPDISSIKLGLRSYAAHCRMFFFSKILGTASASTISAIGATMSESVWTFKQDFNDKIPVLISSLSSSNVVSTAESLYVIILFSNGRKIR